MPDRPQIPVSIQREILVEAGHRCAVCGEGTPLERAHIVPWRESRHHQAADLICLCANCHQRADLENWGERTLRQYKEKPWVLKRYESNKSTYNDEEVEDHTTQVTIKINFDLDEFTDRGGTSYIKSGLSSYLGISPDDIRIVRLERSSVILVLDMPTESAERLVAGYTQNDSDLLQYLSPMNPIGITMTQKQDTQNYVGTIVGESTSREFRLAVAHETIREQDIIAVDAELKHPSRDESTEKIRIWTKVQRIERLNPLFPSEAGHELAATHTDPFDTVLSLSREMVTAVCQVLGAEPMDGKIGGKLDQLRYPPKPASSAYRPTSRDIARVVLGELQQTQNRALDIATLSNRPDVDVKVDGHSIVTRHLAILAMTGAGKSWTARRVIEQLANKNYPIVIFDPHGDYSGLAELDNLRGRVTRYYAQFPVFEEDAETVAQIVNNLGYELSPTMLTRFPDVVQAAKSFWVDDDEPEMKLRSEWLANRIANPRIKEHGARPNMWLIAHIAEAGELSLRQADQLAIQQLQDWGWAGLSNYSGRDTGTLEAIKKRTYKAAASLYRMEQTSQKIAGAAAPIPIKRTDLVNYGKISVVSLAGYTADFQATIYSLVADDIFEARVRNELKLPVLFVLEEAHNFAPAHAMTAAEQRAIATTRQIAQEGRKFGVGLTLISQRPSRLDETTLSQCNSYIIMRMVNPADQSYVRKVVETLAEDEARLLPDLDVGEAILSGQLINFPVLVKMKQPASKGEREEQDAFEVLEEAHANVGNAVRR